MRRESSTREITKPARLYPEFPFLVPVPDTVYPSPRGVKPRMTSRAGSAPNVLSTMKPCDVLSNCWKLGRRKRKTMKQSKEDACRGDL